MPGLDERAGDQTMRARPPTSYAPIPKVASGNIKRWMLLEAGVPEVQCRGAPGGVLPVAERVFRASSRSKGSEDGETRRDAVEILGPDGGSRRNRIGRRSFIR